LVNRAALAGVERDANTSDNALASSTLVWAGRKFLPLAGADFATTAPGCAEMVRNGGFEEAVAWIFPITASTAGYTASAAHAGTRSARFGLLSGVTAMHVPEPRGPERNILGEMAPEGATYSSGYQTIRIPDGARSAILSFWYFASTDDPGHDFQRALLLRPGTYEVLKQLMRVTEDERAWKRASFDLTAYRGREVVVYFEVYNDSNGAGGRTWMYLDDVSVMACDR
jgi:hypothetical protein